MSLDIGSGRGLVLADDVRKKTTAHARGGSYSLQPPTLWCALMHKRG